MKPLYIAPRRTAGLNNLKMVISGMKSLALMQDGGYELPDKLFDFEPSSTGIGDGYLPIESVFDVEALKERFCGLCPSGAEKVRLGNAEYLDAASKLITEDYVNDAPARSELSLDYLAFQPALELKELANSILSQLPDVSSVCAVQLRVERDWHEYAAKKGWRDGMHVNNSEIVLNHCRIFDKIAATPHIPRTLFLCCDEDDLIVSHEQISVDARSRGLEVVFKSSLSADLNSRMKKSVIDFSVCEKLIYYVGTPRSTFSNRLCMVKAASIDDHPEHYVFDTTANELQVRRDFGRAVQPSFATK